MPTITPQGRVQIGGSPEEFIRPRATITASTVSGGLPTRPALVQTPKTGQPATTEETQPKEVTLSPQLTALAKKQQAILAREAAVKAREADVEARLADYVPKSGFKAKLEQSGEDALKELGLSYEEITQILLARQNGQDPVKALESKIEKLQQDRESDVNKQYEATLKQYRAEADALVSADLKAFHLISKGKHQDAVVQHIVETWKENPDSVLTVAQAAKEVEEVLREKAKEMADALKELEPPAEETPPQNKKTLPPPKQAAPRTLTNQVDTTPQRVPNQMQHLSMKERLAESIRRAQR